MYVFTIIKVQAFRKGHPKPCHPSLFVSLQELLRLHF
jgi:hypothetical protein